MSQPMICTSCGFDLSGHRFAFLFKDPNEFNLDKLVGKGTDGSGLYNPCCRMQFFSKMEQPIRNRTIEPRQGSKYSDFNRSVVKPPK